MEEQSIYGISLSDIKSKVEYENGTYYTTSTYSFYVPNDVNNSTNAVIYYPGSGGSGNDAAPIRSIIEKQSPEQIIVIPNTAYENPSEASSKYLSLINNIGNANSVDISYIQNYGFSAGGRNGIQGICNTIASGEDLPPQKAVIIEAGYNCQSCGLTDEQIKLLKDNESTLIFFEETRGGTSSYNVQNIAAAGVDVVVAWAKGGHDGHVQINREVIENGILNYASGLSDTLQNQDIYTFMAYDTENGKWYEISAEEVAEKFASDSGAGLYKYYDKLSSLTDLQSSNSFIQSEINMIRNAIKNTSFLSNTSGTIYESTTNIPNAEADLVQSYFAACSKLLNFLEKDTVKIVEIGELIKSTGDELAVEASELNNVASSDTSASTLNYYSNNNSSTSNNSSASSWVSGAAATTLGASGLSNSSTHATYSYGVSPSGTTVYSGSSTNTKVNSNTSFSSSNLTSSDYEVPAGGIYNYDGIEKHLENIDGVTVEVPDGLGSVHSYMGWQCITAKSSTQYKLREAAGMNFDEEGFAKIGDRYVVAVTTTFGNVGDYIDVYQEDGSVIQCVIGDIKSQGDAGCTKWGHNNGQCVVEFVVDKSSWYGNRMHSNPGTSSCHPEWNQNITKIVNKGNFFELIQTDAAKLEEVV